MNSDDLGLNGLPVVAAAVADPGSSVYGLVNYSLMAYCYYYIRTGRTFSRIPFSRYLLL